ncbi:MAG: DUF6580 family putative transport protein [Bacteroidia bacterium]
MNDNNQNKNLVPAILLLAVAGLSRFIPHPGNFTAIGAMALFSGAVIADRRLAFLLPMIVMLVTDFVLGLHVSMIPVYACFALTVFIGTRIGSNPKFFKVVAGSLLASVIFYLVTNLPIWYADQSLYPLTFAGTMESYTQAIPFFRNQVMGDLFYSGLLFGIFSLYRSTKRVTA